MIYSNAEQQASTEARPNLNRVATERETKMDRNVAIMRGRAHEKTMAEWGAELDVAVSTVSRYCERLGEKCKSASKNCGRHMRGKMNATAAESKRQKAHRMEQMRGKAHTQTAGMWSAQLGVGEHQVRAYARELGEIVKKAPRGRAGSARDFGTSTDKAESNAAAMMARWATRPIR